MNPKILSSLYDETIKILPVEASLIIASVSGSHSYGLQHPLSDIDIRGVYALPRAKFTGASIPCTSFESDEPFDFSIKEVAKFVKLLGDGNPHTLETVWGPEDCRIHSSVAGDILRFYAPYLISLKCVTSYLGYLGGQIKYAQRMGVDHRRYTKTKRHIARLILATDHLITFGTPLVRLSADDVIFVSGISEESNEADFFGWAEDELAKCGARNVTSFRPEISLLYLDLIIEHIRQTQEETE